MARERQSAVVFSYWLTICVLLMYQQPAEMALAMDVGIATRTTHKDPIDPRCSDWEVFDGTDCVCATDVSARCTDKGGMVCDNMGSHYKPACSYALKTCQQKVPLQNKIETCGLCSHLQLVGQDSRVVATFSRIGHDNHDGFDAEYQSLTNNLLVFYTPELGAWAVGRKNINGTFITMRQVQNSTYPQDNSGGMLVAIQKGGEIDWQLDPFMHFECVQRITEKHRHKRFFFVAFVAVGLAATATSTTLKVAQATKGCLYYPSVCKLRDRIRNHLKPEVTRLRDRFVSTYGDPSKLKKRVDKIHDQTLDIRDKVTTVKELHVQLKLYLSNLTVLSSSIQDEFPEFKNALLSYDGWVKNLNQVAAINLLALQLEVVLTLPGLMAASVGSFALAAAGIGALVAVGFAVVDVISSVKEEKQVRKDLRDTESKYLKAKADLESAFANVKQFQRKFCSSVIAFYRKLSAKGRIYHNTFGSLYSYISKMYGHSASNCATRFSRSNLQTLTQLSNQYLQPLTKVLAKDIDELRRKIAELKEANTYLTEITRMVKSDLQSPTTIFRAIKASKPKFMSNTFSTLWDLLYFMAKQVLPTTSCYWGYNLAEIRAGTITKINYNQASICNSTEIQTDVKVIKHGIINGFAPCKIFLQVNGQVFRSRYSVIKFIADHVLESSSCYWGYDLANIRGQQSDVREVDTALVNSVLFQTINYFQASTISTSQISSAREILCGAHAICTSTWQNFILCNTWRGHDDIGSLGCPLSENSDTSSLCVPGTEHFETCN